MKDLCHEMRDAKRRVRDAALLECGLAVSEGKEFFFASIPNAG
jgi:hypothetical protein